MSSNVPTIRQTNWFSLIPHFIIQIGFIFIYHHFNVYNGLIYSFLSYIIILLLLNRIIPKSHRKGISLTNQLKFEEAIEHFEKSYLFFQKYNWLDKYRIITLLSASKMTYKEMALCNIAFCYSQIGEGEKAKEYYNKVIQKYPKNTLAKAGLNMLNSVSEN